MSGDDDAYSTNNQDIAHGATLPSDTDVSLHPGKADFSA
jgi:hypothetical protein